MVRRLQQAWALFFFIFSSFQLNSTSARSPALPLSSKWGSRQSAACSSASRWSPHPQTPSPAPGAPPPGKLLCLMSLCTPGQRKQFTYPQTPPPPAPPNSSVSRSVEPHRVSCQGAVLLGLAQVGVSNILGSVKAMLLISCCAAPVAGHWCLQAAAVSTRNRCR